MMHLSHRSILLLVVTSLLLSQHGSSSASTMRPVVPPSFSSSSERHLLTTLEARRRRRVVVEGSIKPLRFSPSDVNGLLVEQDQIIQAVKNRFGDEAVILHAQKNIANAIFISLLSTNDDNDDDTIDRWISGLPGVTSVSPSIDLEEENSLFTPTEGDNMFSNNVRGALDGEDGIADVFEIAERYLGVKKLRQKHCLTGRRVRVAVVDSGIDYTHSVFGGEGTAAAFQNAAKSVDANGLFPTARVVDGRNFLKSSGSSGVAQSTNPLDKTAGHGTAVASAIVAMAPEVELIAAKVCTDDGVCPDYAVIEALDYAVEVGADIVNRTLSWKAAASFLVQTTHQHMFLRRSVAWTVLCEWVLPCSDESDRRNGDILGSNGTCTKRKLW